MSLFWIFWQIYVYFRQLLIIWNIANIDLTDKYLASIITFLFVSSVLNLALLELDKSWSKASSWCGSKISSQAHTSPA